MVQSHSKDYLPIKLVTFVRNRAHVVTPPPPNPFSLINMLLVVLYLPKKGNYTNKCYELALFNIYSIYNYMYIHAL